MAEYPSDYFGVLTYKPESAIQFPEGLPGFPEEKSFLLVEQALNKPLLFLQSLTRPDLCFMTLPVAAIQPGYRLAMAPEELETLGLPAGRQPEPGADVLCLAILALNTDGPPTANLLSPVVINLANRRAVQAIRTDGGYSHRHPLVGVAEEVACS
jgi:flagellar assembly factor FliW